MSKEKTNYSEHVLNPEADVLLKPAMLLDIQRFVGMVKNKHTNYSFPQQTTYYNKKDHKPIDSSKKISDEKLKEDYYQNINLDNTEKKGQVVYDEIGLSAIKFEAAFEEVFRYNVDKGNSMPRPIENSAPQTREPVLVKDES